jgi:hypothetical protein
MAEQNKDESTIPVGEPFSRLYLQRGAPTRDSTFFRNRLDAFIQANYYKDYADLTSFLKQEAGLVVPSTWGKEFGLYYNFPKFLTDTKIEYVLSAITFIWRFLRQAHAVWKPPLRGTVASVFAGEGHYTYPQADQWHKFVARAFREENLAYRLDEQCGVHYFVDEEFERNRLSTLMSIESPRYSAVRAAFQAAHQKLEQVPPDLKGALRDLFESVETLTKLISGSGKSLDAGFVRSVLEPRIQALYDADAVAKRSSAKGAQSFSDWVDAAHPYRHGHEVEAPVSAPLELVVLLSSQGASFIRWLADLDRLISDKAS